MWSNIRFCGVMSDLGAVLTLETNIRKNSLTSHLVTQSPSVSRAAVASETSGQQDHNHTKATAIVSGIILLVQF